MTQKKLNDGVPSAAMYLQAVQRVVDAVTEKGPSPRIHDAAMARLRDDWPTLANALDNLVLVHIQVIGP